MSYQLLPPLTEAEYEALKASIAEHGILVPIELDDEGSVLEGHHRLRAALELDLDDYPSVTRPAMSEEEKLEHILTLNLDRRHLTKEQRAELVANLRQEGWSLRRIGEKLQIGKDTVSRDLAGVANETPEKIEGADGKSYPARHITQPEAWQNIYRSESNEWYTPIEYLDSARAVLGGIDVDPASADAANEMVQAATYYTAESDGLLHDWPGRVWLNPPWGGDQSAFVEKLMQQFEAEITTQAILLVNAHSTETGWFQPLWNHTLCFTNHRINFYGTTGSGSTHGSVFVYLGANWQAFAKEFQKWGAVVRRVSV